MPPTIQSLFAAILADDLAQVKTLLKRDPTLALCTTEADQLIHQIHWIYRGDTALHLAAATYRVEIAKALLFTGADPAAAQNRRHSQPLHYAADGHFESPAWNPKHQVALIRLLLKAGARINAPDQNGATPLHRAVRNRCTAAVKCLLDAGADSALKNKPGSTAFHLAVQNTGRGGSGADAARTAQREIIQSFLGLGLNPKQIKDESGKSVLEWAKTGWIRELLLTSAG